MKTEDRRRFAVLVVDDEPDVRLLVDHGLREAGFATRLAEDAAQARAHLFGDAPPDAAVVDVMLPDVPGTTLCREIRQNPATEHLPVLLLTARGEELDRVVGFELGADDYVTKPFSVRELVLRVKALLRRSAPAQAASAVLALGPLEIDSTEHRALLDGEELPLTPIEFRLLEYLAARPGRLCTRESLLRDVWGYAPDVSTRTVDTHIKRLREKLGSAREAIETVRGIGYRARSR